MTPYTDIEVTKEYIIREFNENIDPIELMWYRDDESRTVERMLECMPGSVQDDGYLGYCWMHSFKCHSERTCYTWAAGGPIDTDKVSYEWKERKGND